jgi:hypothetical protein
MRSPGLEKRESARERCAFKGGTEGALFSIERPTERRSDDFLFS